eukprot:gene12469-biopygen6470
MGTLVATSGGKPGAPGEFVVRMGTLVATSGGKPGAPGEFVVRMGTQASVLLCPGMETLSVTGHKNIWPSGGPFWDVPDPDTNASPKELPADRLRRAEKITTPDRKRGGHLSDAAPLDMATTQKRTDSQQQTTTTDCDNDDDEDGDKNNLGIAKTPADQGNTNPTAADRSIPQKARHRHGLPTCPRHAGNVSNSAARRSAGYKPRHRSGPPRDPRLTRWILHCAHGRSAGAHGIAPGAPRAPVAMSRHLRRAASAS